VFLNKIYFSQSAHGVSTVADRLGGRGRASAVASPHSYAGSAKADRQGAGAFSKIVELPTITCFSPSASAKAEVRSEGGTPHPSFLT